MHPDELVASGTLRAPTLIREVCFLHHEERAARPVGDFSDPHPAIHPTHAVEGDVSTGPVPFWTAVFIWKSRRIRVASLSL